MSNVALPKISKISAIGDTVKNINLSFETLKNKIDEQNTNFLEFDNFKNTINIFSEQLRFAHDFLKSKQQTYLDTYETIENSREQYLKPLVLFYPKKIREDDPRIKLSYIQNLLYAWITKTYPINQNNIKNPNYVQGQKAIVYFLRSKEIIRESSDFVDRDTVLCITNPVNTINVSCTSRRVGRVCVNRCGCIDCGSTKTFLESKQYPCFFTDYNNQSRPSQVTRQLKSSSKYQYNEYPETKIEFIEFIVDECMWKVFTTNPPPDITLLSTPKITPTTLPFSNKPAPKPVVNTNQTTKTSAEKASNDLKQKSNQNQKIIKPAKPVSPPKKEYTIRGLPIKNNNTINNLGRGRFKI
jgi:hypothetical protein